MKIDFLTNDGSPLGVSIKTLIGEDTGRIGVGGAELAMLTLCEEWTKRGDEVRLYNDPRPGWSSPFEQLPISAFNPKDDRDVLIVFRSPNLRCVGAKGLKVWFSTDQQTIGDFKSFRGLVDKLVLISPYHHEFFVQRYGITDGIVIDLPVRISEYLDKQIEKVKNRFIFTSVPVRGLDLMLRIWPKIKKEISDASLVITSDFRLWGYESGQGNETFMIRALSLEDVTFLSAVPRTRLVEEQLKAEIHVYPCIYDELFCISIAESQVAGVHTITSDIGALKTTNMRVVIPGNPSEMINEFIDQAVLYANSAKETTFREYAISRFHPSRILEDWDNKVFKDG